ncbi:hypothetical protein [Bacillus sp. FJAT-45037]|uniref:hypothetical protein n=1 Tax=Bacillus sp. FJAT-45037 TaxID=2011007 RepID=UPI000C23D670|nr:hypothetical protein [Bacillus sp. FJAT-45037]
MKYNEPDLKEVIKKFELLLKSPDSIDSLYEFKNFLKNIIRTKPKSLPTPTAEFMSIIQRKKPVVFKLLKQQAQQSMYLYILTDINMNYEDAERNLERTKSKLR